MTTTTFHVLEDRAFFISHKAVYTMRQSLIGHTVFYKPLTVSTNDDVLALGQKGFDEGCVVVADEQFMGRGRCGRTWHCPPGVNLSFSILLRPPFMLKQGYIITMMASASVVSAIAQVTGVEAFIKWPNDIMVKRRKAGGILTEVKSYNSKIKFVSLGIGVNVNNTLMSMPEEIRGKAISLKMAAEQYVSRKQLLFSILSELENLYSDLKTDGKASVFKKWRALCKTPGSVVDVSTPRGIISGYAVDVSERGELLIKPEAGDIQKITAGDVAM